MRNEEDEIQVLGNSSKKRKNGLLIWVILVGILMLVGVIFLIFHTRKNPVVLEDGIKKQVESMLVSDSLCNDIIQKESRILITNDTINDVSLKIYSLINLRAELSIGWPQVDDDLYMAVEAADIRKDNGEILGDYVIKGKQIARGKRKSGYVAIIEGNILMGNSITDEVKDYCTEHQGDFFRQYILVADGEVAENKLKGKALRRALAQQGDNLFFIESTQRESLYDFSEGMADMGITNAIYLTGGEAYGIYKDEEGDLHELGVSERLKRENTNFLIFRKK
ncbi:hypothetical protein D0T60_06310 [Bacteroides sp. 224]|nr:hypothetical protein [Bacteroides sp. 224]